MPRGFTRRNADRFLVTAYCLIERSVAEPNV